MHLMCCSLVASPYTKWLKQPLSFNTSNFLQAHWCWKKETLYFFGVPKNTTAPSDWHLSPNFTGFGLVELSEHSPGGRHAQLCPCSTRLWASFIISLSCFNHRNDLHAQESHFQSGSHLCISESISSASASHTQTIHLCDGHQGSSGSQSDSSCLLSRLLVSLAVKVPNQYNSCSCHSSHHQQQQFGLHQQTQMGTGNTPNWCSLSHHTAGRAAPSCPEDGQVPPATQIHTRMCYWCIHLSWCCSVTA